jgi:hypothetical protein
MMLLVEVIVSCYDTKLCMVVDSIMANELGFPEVFCLSCHRKLGLTFMHFEGYNVLLNWRSIDEIRLKTTRILYRLVQMNN